MWSVLIFVIFYSFSTHYNYELVIDYCAADNIPTKIHMRIFLSVPILKVDDHMEYYIWHIYYAAFDYRLNHVSINTAVYLY